MNIAEERKGDVVILQIDGGLGYDTHKEFAETIGRLLREGVLHVIFDMSRLVYLSSWGIGSLLSATAKLRQRGGNAILANVHRDLHHILRIMQLVKVFDIRDSVDDALRAFEAPDARAH